MSYTAVYDRRQTIAEAKRRARQKEIGITLALILLAVEVLKQSPRWLLALVAIALVAAVLVVVDYWPWFLALALLIAGVRGLRAWRDYRAARREIPL
jgi:predicted branched-subunit amino acid permease